MSNRPHHRGFSLIEMLAVLLILALIAGSVAVSLGGAAQRARLEDAVSRFEFYERSTRERAQSKSEPLQLVYKLKSGYVERVTDSTQKLSGQQLGLPPGFTIDQVWTRQERIIEGEVGMLYGSNGCAATYAVMISGLDRQSTWIVVVGLSGQVLETDDVDKVRAILGTVSDQRLHAD